MVTIMKHLTPSEAAKFLIKDDHAPASIMEASCKRDTSSEEIPALEASGVAQLPESTYCLACSEDGCFLSLGHSSGLSVWCASSMVCVAEWLQETVEITSVQMTRMAETTYLLATVDDMGAARVFAYHGEAIHLLSVINILENVNERSICLKFELSDGGDYGAASISCNGSLWLEVYHFPLDEWLKELEEVLSQKEELNSSGLVDLKWSPVTRVIEIRPPKIPAGRASGRSLEVVQMKDFLTYCLALDANSSISQQEDQASSTDAGKTKETNQRCCTHHFLLPCGLAVNSKGKPGFPVAVCVWWSGSHNLLHYLLQKAPRKTTEADVKPLPDEVWPNAKEILCSAVSKSCRYITLGLQDGLICVWDWQTGSPLSVVSISAADSAFCRIQLMDNRSMSAGDSRSFAEEDIVILVLCKSGAIHTVTTGRETPTCTMQLADRPQHSGNLPTVTAPVPFLQSLVDIFEFSVKYFEDLNTFLVVQRNGQMFLLDAINRTTCCSLSPLTTHRIASPCNPVYALNTKEKTLIIKGDPDPRCHVSSEEGGGQSQLFIFHFAESDIMKQHIASPQDSAQQEKLSVATLEELCDLYLQQRVQSLDRRNQALKQTWKQLEETAAAIE